MRVFTVNQWRTTIGCFRIYQPSLFTSRKTVRPFLILFQIFKLLYLCSRFIAISILVLPVSLITHCVVAHSTVAQLRILSILAQFKHNFKDTFNPLCPTNDGIEDTEHFLLLCPSFDVQRRDLLVEISQLLQPFVQINNLSNIVLIKLLLYGDKDFSDSINKSILQLTINFIHKTGQFG